MVIAVDATRQYTVPKSSRASGPAIMLALAMHLLLALFLYFGLNWQSHTPEVIDAEMWSALPQIAAPQPNAPPPVPVPPPVPEPIKVIPPDDTPPQVKPDIEIKEPPKKEPPKKAAAPPPPPPPQPVPKAEPKPAPPPPKPLPAAPSQNNFDFPPTRPAAGTAAISSGPKGSPGYAEKIAGIVRAHTSFSTQGNPTVVVTIQLLPSGEISDVRVTQPSGNEAFDAAVLRGIHDSSPLPKDVDGKVVPQVNLTYHYQP